jgi:flagellar motor protein MotB
LLICVGILSFAIRKTHQQTAALKAETIRLKQLLTDCQDGGKKCINDLHVEKIKYEAAEARMSDMVSLVESSTSELATLQTRQIEANKELAEFRDFTNRFRSMIDSGKLNTSIRRGRMVVNLPAKVLFPSGSAELSVDGQEAISKVTKILRQIKNRRFIVAGHTDTIKIGKADFSSNWDLSAARAVHVTEAMIKSGMNSAKLVASGFSRFDPIADNRTEDQRQKNRRMEIILEPYLPDIPKPEQPEEQKYRRSAHQPEGSKAKEAQAEKKKYRRLPRL